MKHVRYVALASLSALVVLALAWELWLAPLRPGGSWLALKALPLIVPLRAIARGDVYTYRWATMLILAYAAEGIVRAYVEPPPVSTLAVGEIALSLVFFTAAIAYVRARR